MSLPNLLRNSVFRVILVIVGLTLVKCQVTFSSSVTIESGNFVLSWEGNGTFVTFSLESVHSVGWVGFGVSKEEGYMVGSDVVIAKTSDSSSNENVASYYLRNKRLTGVELAEIQNLINYTFSVSDSDGTYLEFTRFMEAQDSQQISISEDSAFYAVWAIGSTSEISEHSLRGALLVDLKAGTVEEVEFGNEGWKLAHGFLMFFSWGILSPIAVILSRSFRDKLESTWFGYHWKLHSFSFLLVLISMFVVFANTDTPFGDKAHHGFGVVAAILMGWQVSSGYGRPQPPINPKAPQSEWRGLWKTSHRIGGRLLLLFGSITMILGIYLLNPYEGYLYFYIVFQILAVLVTAGFELKSWLQRRKSEKITTRPE